MLVLMGSVVCGVRMGGLQNGWTALMSAVENGHDAVVQTLLERGAAVNQADKVGFVK